MVVLFFDVIYMDGKVYMHHNLIEVIYMDAHEYDYDIHIWHYSN